MNITSTSRTMPCVQLQELQKVQITHIDAILQGVILIARFKVGNKQALGTRHNFVSVFDLHGTAASGTPPFLHGEKQTCHTRTEWDRTMHLHCWRLRKHVMIVCNAKNVILNCWSKEISLNVIAAVRNHRFWNHVFHSKLSEASDHHRTTRYCGYIPTRTRSYRLLQRQRWVRPWHYDETVLICPMRGDWEKLHFSNTNIFCAWKSRSVRVCTIVRNDNKQVLGVLSAYDALHGLKPPC